MTLATADAGIDAAAGGGFAPWMISVAAVGPDCTAERVMGVTGNSEERVSVPFQIAGNEA